MKHMFWARGLKFIVLGAAFVAAVTAVVMGLWNALLPDLLGWHVIGFWQALGLLVLSRLLFGGWRGRGHQRRWRARMLERWAHMSEEERAAFRAGMAQRRCGGHRQAATPQAGA